MIGCIRQIEVERYVRGEVREPTRAAELLTHAARCRRCARELELLRRERDAFRARERFVPVPPPFRTVMARIEPRGPLELWARRWGGRGALWIGAAGVAIAASITGVTGLKAPSPVRVTPVEELPGLACPNVERADEASSPTAAPSLCEIDMCSSDEAETSCRDRP